MQYFGCVLSVLVAMWVVVARGGSVTINSDGLTLIDGRKVFPIGLTLPPPPGSVAPNGKDAYAELHSAGVTFIRTGPTGNYRWDNQAVEIEQTHEDAAAKAGLRCMPWLKELAQIKDTDAAGESMLKEVVEKFRSHPGLGIWKGADEPEWGKLPVEPLVRAKQIIRDTDPDHPVWIVQAPRGTLATLRPYDPTYDIAGCDVYPVSYPPGIHSLLPNKEISMVGDYTKTMREVAGNKSVWMTLQIAWSGVTGPGKTLRFPTFEQERFMAYQAIINGARGLVFFGGHIPAAWNERDGQLKWNWTFFNRVLRPVLEEVGENGKLEAALVAPDSKMRVVVKDPKGGPVSGVEFCVRQTPDAIYLLACKREGPAIRVRFEGLPGDSSTGEVMFESPRKVEAKSGAIVDWFGPFDVHVYRFTTSS
jgi:hypothetical protein